MEQSLKNIPKQLKNLNGDWINWHYEQRQGKEKTYILRDPETIASELKEYLDNNPKVPVGISLTDDNKILQWL